MKRLKVFLILCIATIATFAQIKNAGKFGTEIYLNLWNNDDNTLSLIEGVKFRYFISNKFAIRGSINLSNANHKTFEFENESNKEYPPIG